MNWQPIETAPKDSKMVLLYCPPIAAPQKKKGTRFYRARMVTGRWIDSPQDGYNGQHLSDHAKDLLDRHGGFWGSTTFRPINGLPTHWMPLPEPPTP
jgi:hypothetical protein